MAISDVYTARNNNAGNSPVAATSATVLMSLFSTAAVRLWVVGIRVEIGVTAASAGNSTLFQLERPGNAAATSTGSSAAAHDYSAPASIGQLATAWTTTPTAGTVLWEQELPQTTGSAWEEFPPLGYEWGVPAIASGTANTGVHVWVTQSSTSSTPYYIDLIFSE
jgi:hypothetical protein